MKRKDFSRVYIIFLIGLGVEGRLSFRIPLIKRDFFSPCCCVSPLGGVLESVGQRTGVRWAAHWSPLGGALAFQHRMVFSKASFWDLRSVCTNFCSAQVRRRLGSASKKQVFSFALLSPCTNFCSAQVRRRLGKTKQKQAFVLYFSRLALTLHQILTKTSLWNIHSSFIIR